MENKFDAIVIGAGMTGGVTFLLDENQNVFNCINKEIVEIFDLITPEQEGMLKPLIQDHFANTKSKKAKEILSNWEAKKN